MKRIICILMISLFLFASGCSNTTNQSVATNSNTDITSSVQDFTSNNTNEFKETLKYKNKTYVLLDCDSDIFTYLFDVEYYEEKILTVSHNKWDLVTSGGDVYVFENQFQEAAKYYTDDNNYDFFVVFETEDSVIKKSIPIDEDELKYIYNLDKSEKKQTMIFDDIKQFADIVKISKDGLVRAVINLVHVKDSWYWKTEIMTENDEEYIVEMPDSLSKKIFSLK